MKKRVMWIVSGIIVLIIGVIAITVSNVKNQQDIAAKYNETAPKQPERGGPKTVIVENTGELGKVLLAEQFDEVKAQLITYVSTKISSDAESATIGNDVVVSDDNSVSFSVTTKSPAKAFSVVVGRPSYDTVVFTVPADGYTRTTKIFGDPD